MTIPSTNSKLLVAEDWKKIYQSFPNADFQSYDFETLRRIMITYLQTNYPEDFNDFIDSSEYIALVDLIAFLGQNLSFRIDLNARENFLETAQRRDSILRLAQLISYVPTRNVPANGLLKITSISTTDNVIDSNGVNLANISVAWNDPTNTNWYNQFLTIFNSTLSGKTVFGKPNDRNTINGILSEQYKLNSANTDVPVYSFLKNVNGTSMNFEIVSASFSGQPNIYEEPPAPGNRFSVIYQNDNQGSGSSNTGFFCHFKQGSLGLSNFNISSPVPNEIIGVNTPNINDTDVWLWQLDTNGNYANLWTKVPAITGNNIIYNSLGNSIRNVYSVTSRDQDQIDLNFADGNFGNLPSGNFSLFYRQSNGLTYTIKPDQMSGITIEVPYVNKLGQGQTLRLTMSLQYTVNNSASTESNTSIQNKAPQAFYSQNRMVTGEDYNIVPLTISSDILKVKSINRISSGLSKYFDLSDVSGKYSSTNIFANDGIVYKNNQEQSFNFEVVNKNQVYSVIKQQVEPLIANNAMRSFYFDQYSRPSLDGLNYTWVLVNKTAGQSRGYFTYNKTSPVSVGTFSSNNLQYITPGALVKFLPPAGSYFDKNNLIKKLPASGNIPANGQRYVWSTVIQVIGDGSNSGKGLLDDGTGPVIFSDIIDQSAIPSQIIPLFVNSYSYSFETNLVNLCLNQRNFGLAFSQLTRKWTIIQDVDLDLVNPFSLDYQGNLSGANLDASWLVAFTWTGVDYKVRYRFTDYIFESEQQTAFFVDNTSKNYDFTTDSVIQDTITVLSINPASTSTSLALGLDYKWQIDSSIVESDGYVEPTKVKVSFYDVNNSGQVRDPDTFNVIVSPSSTSTVTYFNDKFVYFQRLADGHRYQLVDGNMFTAFPTPADAEKYISAHPGIVSSGDLFYFYDPAYNIVNSYDPSLQYTTGVWVYGDAESKYFAYPGRADLKFQYVHNSSQDYRIDPSKSNIVDVYVLTTGYDTDYRNWVATGVGTEPMPPTSQSLDNNYSASLNSVRTISDEIIFQPVVYRPLFGAQADLNLQATFKVVRNPTVTISDNDIATQVLSAINEFFALENWDFGQSFYFSELSTYVMNLLTPNITNFVIVPKSTNSSFGSLYEVACQSNEIFISCAQITDIQVIEAITASQIKTTATIVTSSGS